MQSPSPSAAPSPHLPVRPDWLDRRREEIIEPDLPIVDPHHHLVERPETGRYLLPELLADTSDGHNITATVYLEWLSMYRAQGPVELRPVGEVEFANGVAAMAASGTYGRTQICAGIVGYADLTLGAPVEKVLQAMIQAGGGRFRGIRFVTASHPEQAAWASAVIRPEGLLRNLKLREGFARLAPLGLSVVEHDLRPGEGARQIDQLAQLGVVHPGVEATATSSTPMRSSAWPKPHSGGRRRPKSHYRQELRLSSQDVAAHHWMNSAGTSKLHLARDAEAVMCALPVRTWVMNPPRL